MLNARRSHYTIYSLIPVIIIIILFFSGCLSDRGGDLDMYPPAQIDVILEDYDPRLPSVTLKWIAVADDGDTGEPASSYEIHYSRSPIQSEDDWNNSCNVEGLPHTSAVMSPASPGTEEIYVISGPDPREESDSCRFASDQENGTWYFAVRARDEIGNISALSASDTVTDNLTFTFTRLLISDRFRDTVLGGVEENRDSLTNEGAMVGDIDNDGYADFVTGNILSNAFCVFYGNELPATWNLDTAEETSGAQRHSCITDPGTIFPAPAYVVFGIHIVHLGDMNGDGLDDFGVSGVADDDGVGTGTPHWGFVLIYLGKTGGVDLSAPNIIIRGIDPPAFTSYFSFSSAGHFTGLMNGSNPVHSIAIGEPAFGSGRLRVISGDSSWTSSGQVTIDLDNLSGTEPILTLQADDTNVIFGFFCEKAGDILPTPGAPLISTDDILITSGIGSTNDRSVFLIPGRPISGNVTANLSVVEPAGDKTGEDLTMLRLHQETPAIANYPSSLEGGTDINGDGVDDIVIGHSEHSFVYIFDGDRLGTIYAGLAPTDSRVVRIGRMLPATGSSFFGSNGFIISQTVTSSRNAVAIIGNRDNWLWSGQNTPELLICDGDGSVHLRTNHALSDNSIELGLFPYNDAALENPAGLSGSPIGSWADGGSDINNDGNTNAIMGTAGGEIIILH